MENETLQIPKIALAICEGNMKRYQTRPSIRKMRKMLKSSLKLKLKNGATAKLRVTYGKAETNQGKIDIFDNQAETKNIDDLKLIFEAFIDKGLWLQKRGGENYE